MIQFYPDWSGGGWGEGRGGGLGATGSWTLSHLLPGSPDLAIVWVSGVRVRGGGRHIEVNSRARSRARSRAHAIPFTGFVSLSLRFVSNLISP